jgi:hypothetical protein
MSELAHGLVATSVPAILFGIYLAGLVVALVVVDAPALPRIGLALLWPLGPIAFAVTIAILLAASLLAFPLVAAIILVVVLAAAVVLA